MPLKNLKPQTIEPPLIGNEVTVTDQPQPKQNDLPAVWDLVLRDIAARDKLGLERYGVRLQPHNGRDVLRDLYEELLDSVVYCRQAIFERDGK